MAPARRFQHHEHATEDEHRTAEQFNWRWSTALTGLTVLFAGLAAFFAYQTYWETRRQANDADTTLATSGRPWLSPAVTQVAGLSHPKDGPLGITYILHVKNFGASPAVHTTALAEMLPVGDKPRTFNLIAKERALCRRSDRSDVPIGAVVFPGDTPDLPEGGQADREDLVGLALVSHAYRTIPMLICVRYEFGRLTGHTAFAMDLVPTNGIGFSADAPLIPANQIQVLPLTGVEEQAD